MATKITKDGRITLPKAVRDAAGIRPGDNVEVRATTFGTVVLRKVEGSDDYKARLYALAKRRLIRGITTDELMAMTRGRSGAGPAAGPVNTDRRPQP